LIVFGNQQALAGFGEHGALFGHVKEHVKDLLKAMGSFSPNSGFHD
jgi:hypothetical protein